MAQLGARLHGMQKVRGSSPLGSNRCKYRRTLDIAYPPELGGAAWNDAKSR